MNDRHSALLGAIARGWCSPENSHKVVDPDLAEAIAKEVAALEAQQSEAVAWGVRCHADGQIWRVEPTEAVASLVAKDCDDTIVPLYTSPTPAMRAVVEAAMVEIARDAYDEARWSGRREDMCLTMATKHYSAIAAALAAAGVPAEVERLREHIRQLSGDRFSDRNHAALKSRAETAEAELLALRARVEAAPVVMVAIGYENGYEDTDIELDCEPEDFARIVAANGQRVRLLIDTKEAGDGK